MLQASCLQQPYCCTENRLAEKSVTLKQPEQIQKGVAASGGIQPVRTGSIQPSHGILYDQRTG